MVIAMRAILIALLVLRHVLPKCLLALLAHERHLVRLCQRVFLALRMALRTIKPQLAARCADRYLRVQNVFAVCEDEKDGY